MDLVRGLFGVPTALWKGGHRLRDLGVNVVVSGHRSLSPEVIERCRAEGADVYAEIGLFQGVEAAQARPELHPVGADGLPLEPDGWYLGLNPAVASYAEERLAAACEAVEARDVDGLWLDFVRWPVHWEVPKPRIEESSFDEPTVRRFAEWLGMGDSHIPSSAVERAGTVLANWPAEWARFKCEVITEWCAECRKRLRAISDTIRLGAFMVPWFQEDHDDAVRRIAGQDARAMSEHIDVFSPMVYHRMCGRSVAWVGETTRRMARATGRPVWPIVQASDVPAEEFAEALREGSLEGGVLIFTSQAVSELPEGVEALREVFVG